MKKLLLLLIISSSIASGKSMLQCISLSDDALRLACYDQIMGYDPEGEIAGNSGIASIITEKLIGTDLKYFEYQHGPARSSGVEYTELGGQDKYYEIAGCSLTLHVRDERIEGFSIQVSPKCSFDMRSFLPTAHDIDTAIPAHQLTVGQFAHFTGGSSQEDLYFDPGNFRARYGNSGDEPASFTWVGSNRAVWSMPGISIDLVDNYDALEHWGKLIDRQTNDDLWIMDYDYCNHHLVPLAVDVLNDQHIARIRIDQLLHEEMEQCSNNY